MRTTNSISLPKRYLMAYHIIECERRIGTGADFLYEAMRTIKDELYVKYEDTVALAMYLYKNGAILTPVYKDHSKHLVVIGKVKLKYDNKGIYF